MKKIITLFLVSLPALAGTVTWDYTGNPFTAGNIGGDIQAELDFSAPLLPDSPLKNYTGTLTNWRFVADGWVISDPGFRDNSVSVWLATGDSAITAWSVSYTDDNFYIATNTSSDCVAVNNGGPLACFGAGNASHGDNTGDAGQWVDPPLVAAPEPATWLLMPAAVWVVMRLRKGRE